MQIMPNIKSIPEYAFEQLVSEIKHFESQLGPDMELGIVANGSGATIHVERLHQAGQMVVFIGVDSELRVARLIQHYTQINVQLVAVNKLDAEPKRIGF